VRASDAVIAICPALSDYARTLTDDHHKILLIENSIFEPVRVRDAGPGTGPQAADAGVMRALEDWLAARPPERVIAYAGTLETYQGIDKMIESFALVARQMPDAGLLIIGGQPPQVEACGVSSNRSAYRSRVFSRDNCRRARRSASSAWPRPASRRVSPATTRR
jgi:glycosyltransferase involved in cell wall biosynthesis